MCWFCLLFSEVGITKQTVCMTEEALKYSFTKKFIFWQIANMHTIHESLKGQDTNHSVWERRIPGFQGYLPGHTVVCMDIQCVLGVTASNWGMHSTGVSLSLLCFLGWFPTPNILSLAKLAKLQVQAVNEQKCISVAHLSLCHPDLSSHYSLERPVSHPCPKSTLAQKRHPRFSELSHFLYYYGRRTEIQALWLSGPDKAFSVYFACLINVFIFTYTCPTSSRKLELACVCVLISLKFSMLLLLCHDNWFSGIPNETFNFKEAKYCPLFLTICSPRAARHCTSLAWIKGFWGWKREFH